MTPEATIKTFPQPHSPVEEDASGVNSKVTHHVSEHFSEHVLLLEMSTSSYVSHILLRLSVLSRDFSLAQERTFEDGAGVTVGRLQV